MSTNAQVEYARVAEEYLQKAIVAIDLARALDHQGTIDLVSASTKIRFGITHLEDFIATNKVPS